MSQDAQAIALLQKEFFKRSSLSFIYEVVYTIDEHNLEKPIRQFPRKAYIPVLVEEFLKNKRLFVAKSRQVMATWTMAALALHQAMFFPYQKIFIISKKENDAFELVKRIRHIYSCLPKWLQAVCPLDRKIKDQPQGFLYFANGSEIRGLPQGPDQIRSFTASLIIIDEASFLDDLEETYGACVPSVAGGGRLVVFSSAGSSYFGTLVEIKDSKDFGTEIQRGVFKKTNSQGITVLSICYWADDDKWVQTENGRRFEEELLRDYPGGKTSAKFRKEMLIDFTVGIGTPVFDGIENRQDVLQFDVSDLHLRFLETGKFYCGVDWGLNKNLTAFSVIMEDINGYFWKVYEWGRVNVTPEEFGRAVHECPYFSRFEWIVCDPTMFNENQSRKDGYTSFARILAEEIPDEFKLYLTPAHGRSDVAFITRLQNYWKQIPPRYRVSRACPDTWREYKNLRYVEAKESKNSSEKIVDKDNHHWDCDKYILLSHPEAGSIEEKPKLGTLGYLNDVAEEARWIAAETGRDYQEVFSELYLVE